MLGRSGLIAALLLFSVCTAPAQAPTPTSDATAAARSLVTTMKMSSAKDGVLRTATAQAAEAWLMPRCRSPVPGTASRCLA
jgi:hypothetical protein